MAVNSSKQHREELIWAFGGLAGGRLGTADKEKALTLLNNTEKPAEIIDDINSTLLHCATVEGWADISRQLVEIHHVDPHVKGRYGFTALHYACHNNHTDIVQYLVNSAHCDPLIQSNSGGTPFDESYGESRDFLQDIIAKAEKQGQSVAEYTRLVSSTDQKHFLKAMGECEEEITQLNIMLHGPPGVGKTSLSRVILGEKPLRKEERNSTKIMEPPVRAIKADQLNKFEGQFEKISEEKMIHLIAEFLKKRMKPQDKTQPRDETQSQDEIQPQSEIQPQGKTRPNRQDSTPPRPRNPQSPSHNQQPIPADSTSTVEALKAINDVFSSAQPSSKMFDSKWLNLIDSGGQPQFQDMLPLLFKGPSFQIVLMRLTEGLDDKPKMCFTVRGENVLPPDDLHLTNLQYIERACQIAAIANPPSKVLIVGTHKDELELKGDVTAKLHIDTLEKGLGDLAKKYNHVILPTSNGKMIFPMNAMATDKVEREGYTKEMQDAITAVITAVDPNTDMPLAKPVSVPLRWFVFQLALRNKASVIRMKDCIELGRLLGMKEKAVKEALKFFNQSAILLYYPDHDAIADLVLTKVDPIIERLSQIVITTFQVLPPKLRTVPQLCTNLREKGLFDAGFCNMLFKDNADFTCDGLTNQEFLELLVSLKLAVLVKKKEEKQLYFLPSALSYSAPADKPEGLAFGLILKDTNQKTERILPHGFFFTTLIELLQANDYKAELVNVNDCEAKNDHHDLELYEKQYRNQITISDRTKNIPGVVVLSNRITWIQVTMSSRDNPSASCPTLYKAVEEAIDHAKSQLEHTGIALYGVVYPCPYIGADTAVRRHSSYHIHYCELNRSNTYTCFMNHSFTGNGTDDMQCWIKAIETVKAKRSLGSSSGSSLEHSNQLTVLNMFNLLKNKSAEWDGIGRAFGASLNDRKKLLQHNPALNDDQRLETVLDRWLESTPNPTWAKFRKILIDSLQFMDVVKQIDHVIV